MIDWVPTKKVAVTQQQHDNLKRLLAGAKSYLDRQNKGEKLSTEFDMSTFSSFTFDEEMATCCGTRGCLAGHGPTFGVPKMMCETWADYVRRVFLPTYSRLRECEVGYFLFSSAWHANAETRTLQHAVFRLEYALQHCIEVQHVQS